METVLIKVPGEKPEIKNINIDIENLEEILEGGVSSVPFPGYPDMAILANDEGQFEDLLPNILLPEFDDVMAGTIIIVGIDKKSGEFTGLTDEKIDKAVDYINSNLADSFEGEYQYKDYVPYDIQDLLLDLFGEDKEENEEDIYM